MADVIPSVQEEILEFWFHGDQQVNYKTKWFPEGTAQEEADRTIHARFSCWLDEALEHRLDSWKNQSTRAAIAFIILCDQFSRHIFRFKKLPAGCCERVTADKMALDMANHLHSSAETINLPMAEYIFSLMPLRHSATVDRLDFIVNQLKKKEELEVKANELLCRFRKQTIRRLQHLQDRAKLEATDDILERPAFTADETNILDEKLLITVEAFICNFLGITVPENVRGGREGAKNSKSKTPNNGRTIPVIEAARIAATKNTPVSLQQKEQQPKKYPLFISLSGGVDSMVLAKILTVIKARSSVLSSYVDEIIAVHIDYANRPESGAEAAFVEEWGMAQGMSCRVRKINEVTRGITSRDEYELVARDIRYSFYRQCMKEHLLEEDQQQQQQQREMQAHDTSTASLASLEATEAPSPTSDASKYAMMFGHHIGDVQENVISNIFRGCSPLDLSGMTDSSICNGVLILRPLLSHTKEDIYEFAHRYGVPYFKDSTPSWSNRGKLRNNLVPLLTEMYGPGCLQKLSLLAALSDETSAMVDENIYRPFRASVVRWPCGLSVNVLPYINRSLCFWKEVLKMLMHSMSMGLIRDKAVGNFVNDLLMRRQKRTQRSTVSQHKSTDREGNGNSSSCAAVEKKKDNNNDADDDDDEEEEEEDAAILAGWLEMRKGYHTFLNSKGELLVLRDGVFRCNIEVYNPVTTKNQINAKKQKKVAGGDRTAKSALPVSSPSSSSSSLLLSSSSAALTNMKVTAAAEEAERKLVDKLARISLPFNSTIDNINNPNEKVSIKEDNEVVVAGFSTDLLLYSSSSNNNATDAAATANTSVQVKMQYHSADLARINTAEYGSSGSSSAGNTDGSSGVISSDTIALGPWTVHVQNASATPSSAVLRKEATSGRCIAAVDVTAADRLPQDLGSVLTGSFSYKVPVLLMVSGSSSSSSSSYSCDSSASTVTAAAAAASTETSSCAHLDKYFLCKTKLQLLKYHADLLEVVSGSEAKRILKTVRTQKLSTDAETGARYYSLELTTPPSSERSSSNTTTTSTTTTTTTNSTVPITCGAEDAKRWYVEQLAVLVASLRKMDCRVKEGLPLLMPSCSLPLPSAEGCGVMASAAAAGGGGGAGAGVRGLGERGQEESYEYELLLLEVRYVYTPPDNAWDA